MKPTKSKTWTEIACSMVIGALFSMGFKFAFLNLIMFGYFFWKWLKRSHFTLWQKLKANWGHVPTTQLTWWCHIERKNELGDKQSNWKINFVRKFCKIILECGMSKSHRHKKFKIKTKIFEQNPFFLGDYRVRSG